MAYVEKTRILANMGEGLLCRLYMLIRKLNSNEKPAVLESKEFKQIRNKAQKNFPELPDLTKVQNGDIFANQAAQIVTSLSSFDDLVTDMVDFTVTSLTVLLDMPRDMQETKQLYFELIDCFCTAGVSALNIPLPNYYSLLFIIRFTPQFELTQTITIGYLDLFVCYVRVMMLFASIHEKRVMYALLTAATYAAGLPRSPLWNDAILLLSKSDNLFRHFVDNFGLVTKLLKPMILQVKSALNFAENIDQLRNTSFLNPIGEGDLMGRQSTCTLTQNDKLSAYSEILNVRKYVDYVIIVHLACPPLLYDDYCLDLFKQVASGILFVQIYRDVTLSIHDEFEKLLLVFPNKQDKEKFKKPHGYKLKNKLRDLAKVAIRDTHIRLRLRQSYITAELEALRRILLLSPGLIGPKFPMIMAAAAIGKAEVINYFMHVDQQELIRKDCRKQYIADNYISISVTTLLWELVELFKVIRKYRCIVITYYAEYLYDLDLPKLDELGQQLSVCYPLLKSYTDGFISTMKEINVDKVESWMHESLNVVAQANDSPPQSFDDAERLIDGNYYPEFTNNDKGFDFEGFRINAERCLCIMSSHNLNCFLKTPDVCSEFSACILSVYLRTKYLDHIEVLLRQYVLPFECYWFRNSYFISHTASLSYQGSMIYNEQSLVYIYLARYVHFSAHSDNTEEIPRLIQASQTSCQGLISATMQEIVKQVEYVYNSLLSLENQCRPIEAAYRLQKVMEAKKKRSNNTEVFDPLPGYESAPWIKSPTAKLQLVRAQISQLISVLDSSRFYIIHGQEYDLQLNAFQEICKFFTLQFKSLFYATSQNGAQVMDRLVNVRIRYSTLCHVIQIALSSTVYGASFMPFLRSSLRQELLDTSVPLPGSVIPHDLYNEYLRELSPYGVGSGGVGGRNTNPILSIRLDTTFAPYIWKLSSWFESAIEQICLTKTQHIFNSKSRAVIALPPGRNTAITNGEIDTRLNIEDLRLLCQFIGPHGVRCIDSHLIKIIARKVKKICLFLTSQRTVLLQLRNECMTSIKAGTQLKGLVDLDLLLIQIGVTLGVRSMLHEAVGEAINSVAPSLSQVVNTVTHSLAPSQHSAKSLSTSTLASDLGCFSGLDISLAQSLAPLFKGASNGDNVNIQNLWEPLFPVAAASIFLSEQWDNSNYLLSNDGFDKNEHCSVIAISTLLSCISCSSLAKTLSQEDESDVVDTSQIASLSEEFLTLASQIILHLKQFEHTTSYTHRPIRAMSLMLETFVTQCPHVDRQFLERRFPFNLLHINRADVSLSKQRYADTLSTYNNLKKDPQLNSHPVDKELENSVALAPNKASQE